MWVWSKLSASRWADAWQERFCWNPSMVITELKGGKRVRVDVYCMTKGEAGRIQEQFGGSVRHLTDKDWMGGKPSKKAPLKIRDRLLITPETTKAARKRLEGEFPGRIVLSIPPEMAFGTGDHATTATCLRLLVDEAKRLDGSRWRFLDLGCGSGILALAARELGAEKCQAVDYDPRAVEVAERNLERNGVDGVTVREADVLAWRPRGRFEVVAANLFANVLQEAFPMMVSSLAEGGRLIVSGILADQWPETRRAGEAAGLKFVGEWKRGKWVTALAVCS